ncbi:hypothetical protein QE382_003757 [Sphingobacterium zeae]|uniref:Outer membrane insertion C-terminal signal n=2 Tax=Sphingobacteriaceae TaxID=84566 RepID=A0ABU0UAB1_9SPHI|nr:MULTISPECIES: hypothetical protein [Sphingobacterium]MDQ1151773.1 hypothetical protein [Sphingobacterium zeae]
MDQMKKLLTVCLLLMISSQMYGQEKIVKGSLFEGIVVAGYADHGAYINCTGPALKYTFAPKSCLLVGLLPSLKLKEDKVDPGKPKNSWITPSLGFGLTAVFRHIAIQLPAFYTAKTSAADGKWRLGVGMGYKF